MDQVVTVLLIGVTFFAMLFLGWICYWSQQVIKLWYYIKHRYDTVSASASYLKAFRFKFFLGGVFSLAALAVLANFAVYLHRKAEGVNNPDHDQRFDNIIFGFDIAWSVGAFFLVFPLKLKNQKCLCHRKVNRCLHSLGGVCLLFVAPLVGLITYFVLLFMKLHKKSSNWIFLGLYLLSLLLGIISLVMKALASRCTKTVGRSPKRLVHLPDCITEDEFHYIKMNDRGSEQLSVQESFEDVQRYRVAGYLTEFAAIIVIVLTTATQMIKVVGLID